MYKISASFYSEPVLLLVPDCFVAEPSRSDVMHIIASRFIWRRNEVIFENSNAL
jgi:hypothetical protein